ncbi:MAG: acylneuraminate cytidylyltransferase family protein [Bacteroidetes bacterium]|nr:acylneuraminate cytidylyltransferase family protein [Bacteroidota bacterium]
MRTLYLIPARGGSKGLPGKNIRPVLGKPLIAWTIGCALEAARQRPGAVVVSTDDPAIAEVARAHGALVPFLRPAELAQDTSASIDAVLHALDMLEGLGERFDLVCLLEATSPLRTPADVVSAIDRLLASPGAESIVGIGRCVSGHPAFLVKKDAAGTLSPFLGDAVRALRRQELDDVYFLEGSLYIARVSTLAQRRSFYHDRTLGFEVADWKTFEVDDLKDLLIVERLLQAALDGTLAS